MKFKWIILQFAICFALGVLTHTILTTSLTNGEDEINYIHPHPEQCPPISLRKPHTKKCNCTRSKEYTHTQSNSEGRSPEEMEQYRQELEDQAIKCEDDMAKKRFGIPMMSNVLARCAQNWLETHKEILDPSKPQSLFDYSYDAMDYPFVSSSFEKWLVLTSFLPQDTVSLPEKKGSSPNQLLLGTPILHRLQSMFATGLFFDVQLALRFEEIVTYATPINHLELMAKMIGMARTTYLVLGCISFSDLTDWDLITKAASMIPKPNASLGLHHLEVKIERLAVFKYRTCTKELIKVSLVKMNRTGRAKWCYYPSANFGRLSLNYRKNVLSIRDTQSGKEVNWRHPSGLPYIPMSELLGWGVVHDTRDILLGHYLTGPVRRCPYLSPHNIVVLGGGDVGCRPFNILLENEFLYDNQTI